ncbi:MAG: energy-coupling factor transporter ATPase [Ruminococcaceae bacterium]|nr:energy-coupling factor transporter ATPase [Oscillospiraceae bacterium]
MGIKIENLNYIYMQGSPFEKHALKDINLEISDGEFIGLIGHTGSGKSTLIQHLNGLMEPTSGTVIVDDTDIFAKTTDKLLVRRNVGLVFQYPEHQLFEETVYKDISFGPINLGLSKEEIHERVLEAMCHVGLDESFSDVSPFSLSGGQKRRVAIAGVLAMKPSVLILDEPTAGLDPAGREEILTQIKALRLARKMTVIFVSHSMEDVAKIAERIIVMNKGTIAMDGKPNEIFRRSSELIEMGLDIPQISKLILSLRERGLNINPDIYTVEKARTTLSLLISTKNDKGGNLNAQ